MILLQSSSASRVTARASQLFILSQSGERPERFDPQWPLCCEWRCQNRIIAERMEAHQRLIVTLSTRDTQIPSLASVVIPKGLRPGHFLV